MKAIIVAQQYTTKNMVQGWMVGITGESKARMFLRTAKKAMGYMFILKNQTGLQISENCLQRLSFAHKQEAEEAKVHAAKMAWLDKKEDEEYAKIVSIAEQQKNEAQEAQPEKKQRKSSRRSKKNNQVSAQ